MRLITRIRDPRGAAQDFRYALDCSKIRVELGWGQQWGFEGGVQRTLEWYLANRAWVESVITSEYKQYYQRVYVSR